MHLAFPETEKKLAPRIFDCDAHFSHFLFAVGQKVYFIELLAAQLQCHLNQFFFTHL